MSKAVILLADDDAAIRLVISRTLTEEGYTVRSTPSPDALMRWINNGEGDLLITDVYMDERTIFDHFPQIKLARPNLPVIVISAQNTVLTAASSAEHGAFDYLPKPFDIGQLSRLVSEGLKHFDTEGSVKTGRGLAEKDRTLPMIGRSPAMQDVYRTMSRVMNTDLNVLITGETGCGKGLAARAIHDLGQRSSATFIALNLADMPYNQLDRELFGDLSYTGSHTVGKIEKADGGTLFLDEIGDAPLETQAQLLRFLQEPIYRHHKTLNICKANTRIIAATSRDLREQVQEGRFREDLFYWLNVMPMRMPPLRDRKEDISELVQMFLLRIKERGLPEKRLDKGALKALLHHDWPGNARELENLILHISVISPDKIIKENDIKQGLIALTEVFNLGQFKDDIETVLGKYLSQYINTEHLSQTPQLYPLVINAIEEPLIRLALSVTGGNQLRAASLLGINRNTLRSKITSLNIE